MIPDIYNRKLVCQLFYCHTCNLKGWELAKTVEEAITSHICSKCSKEMEWEGEK